MHRAIGLARPGTTWPNPPVGCVIVKDGVIIGEGFTGAGGRPHAEEVALDMAGENAKGATVYVTLEPCGQRSGGGKSCSEKLVDAEVARVIFACDDPSPYAAHKGVERLKAATIEAEIGLLATDAYPLIAGFVHFLSLGRPLVTSSETPHGFDAQFVPDVTLPLKDDLTAWGVRGYRSLYVCSGSDAAKALRAAGLLAE